MSVKRIAEQPRVTAPFSEEAWAALNALGEGRAKVRPCATKSTSTF
jgi:uncharacterized protein (DUF2126 family)